MSLRKDQINWLLTIAALLVLVALVVAVTRIESSYREAAVADADRAAAAFAASNVLKDPEDGNVNIEMVEDLAEYFQASETVEQLFVVRPVPDDPTSGSRQSGGAAPRYATRVLYPFYYAARNPAWREKLAGMRHQRPVVVDGEEVGRLYFQIDEGPLGLVRILIVAAVLPIVLALSVLIARVFSQERVLTATTEVLERNQQELIRMERLALAGLLTANIFHDIRKPITNIKHELADLSEALGGFAGATRALRNMREQVMLFFDVLRDLNLESFVRSDEAEEEYVDLNRVVEQSLRLVQYERGSTKLDVTLAPGLPLVLARPYRLVQVVSNIILNAYQAVEGRGELRIRTAADLADSPASDKAKLAVGHAPGRQAAVLTGVGRKRPAGDFVLIEIADNGPGIAAEDLRRIFSPFYTTKPSEKGTGLGLYISRTLVEMLGGTLEARSEAGKGTRFLVRLPASD